MREKAYLRQGGKHACNSLGNQTKKKHLGKMGYIQNDIQDI